MKRLLVFFMAITFAIQGWSQTIPITIGTGTTSASTSALPGLYGYNISAHLYSASEIGVGLGGSIESLEYNISSNTVGTGKRVKIYLIEITDASINLNQSWTSLTSSATLVYDSTSFYTPTSGWKKFAFSSPFSYTGTGNLLVLTEGTGCTTSGGCSMTIFTNPGLVSNCFNRYKDSTPLSFTTNLSTLTEGSGNITNRANIKLNIVPNPGYCYPAIDLISSNITTNSADFSWTTHATGNSWVIQHKPSSDTNWSIEEYVNTGFYSLQSLNSDAAYKFRVKSICDISESAWTTISFRTSCDNIYNLPFENSFDEYGTGSGTFPSCWTKITSNTYPYISTTNSSAPGSMYLYTASGAYNYVVTPPFDSSIPINSLSAFFKLYKGSAAYNITVGVMSNPTDITTFDSITNLTPSATSTWETFGVNFENYTGTGQHIAFRVKGVGATNSMYIDDLSIDISPTCQIPTGLARTIISSTSIELDWNSADDANVLSWIVEYKPLDSSTWQTVDAYSHPFTLSGLQPSIVYNVRLYAVCSTGETTYPTPIINAGMPCEAISTFPWSEGFEGAWYVAAGLNTGTHPWCWTNINGGASTTDLWRKTTTSSYVRTGSGAMQMYTSSTTAQLGDWMITPTFSLTGNERLRFWAKGYSTYTDVLSIKILDVATNGIVEIASDTSLFVDIMPNTVIPASDWTEYEINLSQFIGDYQIAFVRNTKGGYYLNIDDVSISEIPACAKPSNLTATGLGTYMDITFTPGNMTNTEWYIYYKPSAATTWDSVYTNTTTTTIPNLILQTTYQIYVKTLCSDGTLSDATQTITYTTPCFDGEITSFPWTEGFEGGLSCWTLTASGTAANSFWRTQTTGTYPTCAPHGGTNMAQFNCFSTPNTAGTWTTMISPAFDFTSNMQVSFWIYRDASTSYISPLERVSLYVASSQSLTDSVLLGAVARSMSVAPVVATEGWYQYTFLLPTGTIGTRYIALKATSNYGNNIYIDDVTVELAPECPNVSGLTVGAASTTSISVNWTDVGDDGDGYNIAYATNLTTPFDPTTAIIIPIPTATTLPYIIPGFNSGDSVWIAVQRGCFGTWTDVQKVILPGDASTLPYSYNFEDPTTYNTWTLYNGTQTNKWYIGAPGANGTGNGLFISNNNGTSANYASPIAIVMAATLVEFDNSPEFAFAFDWKATGESTYDYIYAYVIPIGVPIVAGTLPSDTYRVTPTYLNLQSTWQRKSISLGSQYSNSIQQIVFAWKNDGSGDYQPPASIDNIEIVGIVCPSTTNLVASNMTTTSADISWSSNSPSIADWKIYWKTQSATAWVDSLIINTNPYTLTGLIANTPYQVKIVNNCGTEYSYPMSILNFRTTCAPIATMPYFENFDTYGTGTTIMPACWVRTTTYADRPYVTTGGRTANCLYFYAGTVGTYNIAAMPPIDASIPMNTLMATFYYKYSSATDRLVVGIMTDPTNASTFDSITTITGTSTWAEYQVNFNGYTGLGQYIAFRTTYNTTNCYGYIDDLTIDLIPACTRPTGLATAGVTATDANITFIPGNATDTQWKIYYRVTGATTWTDADVYAIPYQMTGLTASTAYQVYVTTLCGDGSYSNASATLNFRTPCDAIATLPFIENFDTYGTGTTIMPACWVRTTTYADRPYVQTNGYIGNYLYFYAGTAGTYNIAAMTPIDATIPINTLMATFYYKNSSSTDRLIVGVMTDPTLASTFDTITTITGTTTWTEYEANFSNYTGLGHYIAFLVPYTSTSSYGYLDELTIDLIPACARPTNITATNITLSTADIGFTPGNITDTQWKVYYKPSASTTWMEEIAYTNPHQISGLTSSTPYQAYVTTLCADGSYSNASAIKNFNTACDAITSFPWTENFDALASGEFPACWSRPVIYNGYPKVSTTASRVHSAPSSLEIHSAVGAPTYAVTPQLGADINTLKVKFWAMAESTTSSGTIEVGVMSDPNVLTSFESVQIIQPTTTSYTEYTVTFATTTLTGYNNYIAFRQNTVSAIYYYWIDDIVVDYINPNPCPAPTNITVVPSNTSAAVTWTAGGSESSWEVRLGTTGTPQIVAATNYSLMGLSPSTTYTVYVRANCGSGYSPWIPKTFTTTSQPTPPVVTTTVPSTQILQTTAVFNATYVQYSDTILTKGFEYKTNAATTWTDQAVTAGTTPFTYSATGLTANTAYEVKAYVTTTTFGRTYGNTVAFTTLAITPPTVTTDSVKVLSETSATFYGKITQNTESIEARGFEYKLSTETWEDAINISASGVTTIEATATTLTNGMSYEVRAYARTLSETTYGLPIIFTPSSLNGVIENDISIMMYPNPATSQTNLVVSGINGETKIVLSDVQGRILNTINAKPVSGTIEQTIDLNNLAKGVYYIRIQNSDINRTQKLIVK